MNLNWTKETKEDIYKEPNLGYVIGYTGVVVLCYIIHRYIEGDLFTPSEDYYELFMNPSDPEKFLNSNVSRFNGYFKYSGTLDECKSVAEELLKFTNWNDFESSDLFNKVMTRYE